MRVKICKEKKKLSDVEIAGVALFSLGGALGLAIGGYFLYKHLERKDKLPWKKVTANLPLNLDLAGHERHSHLSSS